MERQEGRTKMKKALALMMVVCVLLFVFIGAGTVTYTTGTRPEIKTVRWDWLSTAGGAADLATTEKVNGQILRIDFIPDAGGTQPTNLYDVVINDADGVDIAQGLGADCPNDSTRTQVPVLTDGNNGNMAPIVCDSKLNCVVSNGGDSKGGQVIIYFKGELYT
jgi:hypothetical protein